MHKDKFSISYSMSKERFEQIFKRKDDSKRPKPKKD